MQLARLIDANANRAREGLRVMEDVARFVLNDTDLCVSLKSIRHDLTAAIAQVGIDSLQLLAPRDTPGDVGTTLSTPAEGHRASTASIVHAAAGRTTEAMRALEEAAKALGAEAAAKALEHARYRTYDAHRRVAVMLGSPDRRQFALCVLLTAQLCTHFPLMRVAQLAIDGGCDCLQLREKSMPDSELLATATALVKVARQTGVAVFINDRPDIALLSGAQGVHVGQTDLPVARVRELVGSRLLIGVSTSNLAEAHAAVRDGADISGVGPMYPTLTKQKPVLAGPAYLREYLADERTALVPHLAIGGITPANAQELARVGCRGIAVSSAVCASPEPRRVCENLIAALRSAHTTS